jgi:hypothetical protein
VRTCCVLLSLAFASQAVHADRVCAGISWPGCSVDTNEEHWSDEVGLRYPVTYLVDDDPRTAWVFQGRIPEAQDPGRGYLPHPPFTVCVRFDEPQLVDGIRIMNGYNKDAATFLRNNRVTEIEVRFGGYVQWARSDTPVKRFSLPDRMGWHEIRFGGTSVRSLVICLVGFEKGRDNDVCLSGLEVLSGDTVLTRPANKVVRFTSGSY